jgi:hypothetical protein
MTFIVEDNTGLEDANAYIEVSFLTDYALSIGLDVTTKDNTQLEQLITDVTYNFIDTRYEPCDSPLNDDQSLQWPTTYQLINNKFRRAVAEACVLDFNDGLFITQNTSGKIKVEMSKLDVLQKSVTYQDDDNNQSSYYPTASIDKLMKPFTCGTVGSISFERWSR